MLPLHIPDVRTIEKRLMNLSPPPNINSVVLHVHTNQNHQQHTVVNNKTSLLGTNNNTHSTQSIPHPEPSAINNVTTTSANNKQQQIVNSCNNNNNSFNNSLISNSANYVNCDNSGGRTVVNDNQVNQQHHRQHMQHQHQQQQQQQQQETQTPNNDENEEIDRPPPVVILSGSGNKEVSGLVFGFDINEQLLHEDICENFISRYVEPECFKNSTHNHDKIVNFIGSGEFQIYILHVLRVRLLTHW